MLEKKKKAQGATITLEIYNQNPSTPTKFDTTLYYSMGICYRQQRGKFGVVSSTNEEGKHVELIPQMERCLVKEIDTDGEIRSLCIYTRAPTTFVSISLQFFHLILYWFFIGCISTP